MGWAHLQPHKDKWWVLGISATVPTHLCRTPLNYKSINIFSVIFSGFPTSYLNSTTKRIHTRVRKMCKDGCWGHSAHPSCRALLEILHTGMVTVWSHPNSALCTHKHSQFLGSRTSIPGGGYSDLQKLLSQSHDIKKWHFLPQTAKKYYCKIVRLTQREDTWTYCCFLWRSKFNGWTQWSWKCFPASVILWFMDCSTVLCTGYTTGVGVCFGAE